VKNLHLKGLALRVRWEWVPRIDESRSWQGLPVIKDVEARDAFDSLVRITVGEGPKILFWRDRWIGGRSAHNIAPGITLHVKTRIKNSRTVAQAMNQNAWINDISGNLATLERGSALRYGWLCTACQGTMLNQTSSPGRGLCLVPTQPDQPTLCCRRSCQVPTSRSYLAGQSLSQKQILYVARGSAQDGLRIVDRGMGCRPNPRLALHAFRKKTPLSICSFNVSWPGRFGSGLRKCFKSTSRRRRARIRSKLGGWRGGRNVDRRT
jgi:hypothetical protein